MCPSSWFQLGSASVLLVGRFSTQISSCSRLAARGPSVRPSRSRIRVISNSGSLSELCIHRGLRWLRVELFLGGSRFESAVGSCPSICCRSTIGYVVDRHSQRKRFQLESIALALVHTQVADRRLSMAARLLISLGAPLLSID
ncbi:hypothetical protein F2Q69_00005659 [Brassica cretica]|uniref:Uncharacterized protein n=1 Tax=Brassica cretica TaxID=69181 RepID=A0A8S9P8M1_BRACR|nr:hypothetical protein F2Q69_00005659 [Brassica cretica]